jgi:hypothetical protein
MHGETVKFIHYRILFLVEYLPQDSQKRPKHVDYHMFEYYCISLGGYPVVLYYCI